MCPGTTQVLGQLSVRGALEVRGGGSRRGHWCDSRCVCGSGSQGRGLGGAAVNSLWRRDGLCSVQAFLSVGLR